MFSTTFCIFREKSDNPTQFVVNCRFFAFFALFTTVKFSGIILKIENNEVLK